MKDGKEQRLRQGRAPCVPVSEKECGCWRSVAGAELGGVSGGRHARVSFRRQSPRLCQDGTQLGALLMKRGNE